MKSIYSANILAAAVGVIVASMPLMATEMDDSIEASAKSSYVFKTYLKDDDVKVDSENGVVTLTGTVDVASHKNLAEDTVGSIPGVKRVDSKLTVNTDEPDKNSDAWLLTKVKSTLLFHSDVSALTDVTAKDGVITLRGNADSEAEKELTAEYAMDIDGVKKVNNEMVVATGSKSKTVAKASEVIDDASITAEVKMVLLSHHSTSAFHTKVETKDGVVTLTGDAKNDAEIKLATKVVGETKGVKKVNNEMKVMKN